MTDIQSSINKNVNEIIIKCDVTGVVLTSTRPSSTYSF